ncbi:branched-chain amino acid transport system permease protein [Neobacillus sp. B4I6]|uniref:Branched-chain amino acid ABC transporter permease n=1 Tax=Priestia megaterium TaxID=1404 RepID=A0A6H1P9J6_PRIMG|nr:MULTISPECIES: branched-chain amino acid ABC transporter permease [Bacillaceae]MBT2700539.1 branched-chain amino acid ABC transporter permease [Bacillus sp. ISL-40]MBT2719986.1 branched-chain amino acid ABC transporter permease [Bacillus sp. ISL-46]MBT2736641.1 branched-chain amino acid ABC transporter permease [Bacillus sp. ISL-7]MBT2742807.1 branched-chain amino acid ABC transporter permease [Bacillus sp. ISL-77]QIZ10294.1 branched-chain amino acid ABC transporter permease [Priestia megate
MELLMNLTLNGLATGMLIFLLAAGLTLIFGLMDVLNFAHGGLFAWGAYSGLWIYSKTGSFMIGIIGAILTGFLLGIITEKWIIKPVYGNHVQQILITLGLMLVLSEMLKVIWGPNQITASPPDYLKGSWELGGVIIIKYRVFIIFVGFLIFTGVQFLLKKTKIGLVVRAGVMNKEMVQALGINIQRVFMFVFMIGAGMAALGGVLLGPYSGVIHAGMGMEFAILAFIVVVIGGMGNFKGSVLAAILVGLSGSFMAYYVPDLSLAVNMLLMAIVLIIRPQGLFGAKG